MYICMQDHASIINMTSNLKLPLPLNRLHQRKDGGVLCSLAQAIWSICDFSFSSDPKTINTHQGLGQKLCQNLPKFASSKVMQGCKNSPGWKIQELFLGERPKLKFEIGKILGRKDIQGRARKDCSSKESWCAWQTFGKQAGAVGLAVYCAGHYLGSA